MFDGNSDISTVVHHDLKKAIVTRLIRIHPITYNDWISMRVEFYGCKGVYPVKYCIKVIEITQVP